MGHLTGEIMLTIQESFLSHKLMDTSNLIPVLSTFRGPICQFVCAPSRSALSLHNLDVFKDSPHKQYLFKQACSSFGETNCMFSLRMNDQSTF